MKTIRNFNVLINRLFYSNGWLFVHFVDSDKEYKADMVLLAMGFLGPEKAIIDEMKMKTDPRGNIETPKNKYSTSLPSVYAAGGMC